MESGAAGGIPEGNGRESGPPRSPESLARRIARRVGSRGFLVAGVLAALAVRVPLLPRVSEDMRQFLIPWFDFIVENGHWAALGHDFSNYNVPYLYFLTLSTFAASYLPKVWAIKIISIVFDFVLAFFVGKCVALRYPKSSWIPRAAVVTTLLLPSVVLNSSWWGQAESIYTAFLVICLHSLLAGKQRRAFLAFGLAFGFKLQAVFLAPLFLWLAVRRAVDWRSFVWSPLTWFVMLLPAWFLGRPLADLLTIYLSQATQPLPLVNRVQNLYQWVPDRFVVAVPLFVLLAVAVFGAIADAIHRHRLRITPDRIVFLATFAVLLAPYLLPKMHDRYFFAAEVFSLLLAFRSPRYWYAPVVLQLAAFNLYLRALEYWWLAPPGWVAVPVGLLILVLARGLRSDPDPAADAPARVRSGRTAPTGVFRSGFRDPASPRFLPGVFVAATMLGILLVGTVRWASARLEERRADIARLQGLRSAIRSGHLDRPLVRSTFDLFLDGTQLVFFREPCAPTDTEARFVLHFHPPADSDRENGGPGPSGTESVQWNRDFDFEEHGRRLDEACVATVELPEESAVRFETGQWDGERRLWRAVRRLDSERFRPALDAIATGAAGEPLHRSVFDLYLRGTELLYHRRDCAPEEVEARFFLHLFPPEDPARGGRRVFENRDFDFGERGIQLDGECLALIPFPADRIAAVRTGQWAAGEPPSWEAALRLDRDRFRARLEEIAAGGQPLVRSTFDLYLGENELLYHRERCAAAEVETRFFVHLAPAARVPREEMDAFGSREFAFGERGVRSEDGRCLAIFPLDPRRVATIDTGQQQDGTALWRTNLRFDPDGRAAPSGSAGERGEPAVASVFDLHYDGTTLTYFKEPCAAEDTTARFFLHLVPSDPASLPATARDAGFENRDFSFPDYGLFLDGECTARVPLPPYPIERIRTGQFVAGGGRLWEASLSPGDGRGSG